MNEQMMQMMMQMMINNQQMTQMVMQMMQQPQPNPTEEVSAQLKGQPSPSVMAQTGAASVNVIANGEVADLKQQLADLKAQIAELQAQNQQLQEQNAALTSGGNKEVVEKVRELENISGKSIDEIMEDIKANKRIVPKKGKGAHDAYAQMIEEGRLDRDTVLYASSDDVLEAIEEASGTNKTVDEVLREAAQSEDKSFVPSQKRDIKMEPVNEFGF